jgi:hypothetical protein
MVQMSTSPPQTSYKMGREKATESMFVEGTLRACISCADGSIEGLTPLCIMVYVYNKQVRISSS